MFIALILIILVVCSSKSSSFRSVSSARAKQSSSVSSISFAYCARIDLRSAKGTCHIKLVNTYDGLPADPAFIALALRLNWKGSRSVLSLFMRKSSFKFVEIIFSVYGYLNEGSLLF